MTPADTDRVCAIIGQHNRWDEDKARDYFPREFREAELGVGRSTHVVAEIDGRVVGCSGWIESQICANGIYWLGWTYVDTSMRGKGIGYALLRHVEDVVRGLGCRKLYLDTGARGYETAIAFYERNGFIHETTLPDYYDPGEACYIMAKAMV